MDGVLTQALIYLVAAAIAVPVAARLGLGSVLGYLIAGIVIGPALGIVGVETASLQQYAQFGVVMMLFLVGLELQPRLLWDMRSKLLGLGGAQVLATSAVLILLILALGQAWRPAVAAGVILSLSSTAIVLQSLRERGLLKTEGGRASFAILLFQDIAVIPIIALLPLLATGDVGHMSHEGGEAIAGLPGWQKALITFGSVAVIVIAGRFAVRPALRIIARTRMREMFTVAALLLVVAITWLMTLVGLSPALGTFLAGVVLADSEFRHELESDIEPFKGLLLGLFFITVGAGADLTVLTRHPILIAVLVAGLVLLKIGVLYPIARLFKLPPSERWLTALSLAQGGEFAFVLVALAGGASVISADFAAVLVMAVTLSMLVTPALFVIYSRLIQPCFKAMEDAREPDRIDEQGEVIVAGIGRFGQITSRLLRANNVSGIVLDHSQAQLATLAIFGAKGYYGDASRPELLEAAGIANAKVLVVAIDDQDKAVEMVRHVAHDHRHVTIVARAYDRLHYYRLREAGAHVVVRELFEGSVQAAEATLKALGYTQQRIAATLKTFRKHDEQNLEDLYEAYLAEPEVTKNQDYISRSRAAQDTLAEVLARDDPAAAPPRDEN